MSLGALEYYFAIALIAVAYASWKTHEVQKKIYCEFIRADNTIVKKWASFKQRRIIFDGGWYNVETDRIIGKVWNEGFPFIFFPTRGAQLLFRFNSDRPLDPEHFENTWPTPEARAHLDKEDDIRAYNEGNRKSLGGKTGKLEAYMPIIILAGFAIMGYFVYTTMQKVDLLGAGQNAIQGMIGQLLKK